MSQTRMLLVSPLEKEHRHLGCLMLYSFLRRQGRDIDLLFIPDKNCCDSKKFIRFVKENAYDLVGFSVMTLDYYFTADLCGKLRASLPGVKTIWGGIHPTTLPEESLLHADFLCSGKGEEASLALLRMLDEHQTDFAKISGLSFKNGSHSCIAPHPAVLSRPLDDYPHVWYDWKHFFLLDQKGIHPFTLEDYRIYSKHNGDSYSLMTAFSCPFNCSYCINSFLNRLYHRKGKVERRSVSHVIQEIKDALVAIPSVHFINFLDDQFLTDRVWLNEFLQAYQEISMPFIIRAAPKTFDLQTLEKLKKIGLQVVQMGIQSGSERVHREIFFRHFDQKQILDSAALLSRAGVKAIYDIIIENEFEEDQDRDKTLRLILKLKHPYALSLFSLTPFPGTQLIELYRKKNQTPVIDPYKGDYTVHEGKSFHFKLAALIPHLDHDLAAHLVEKGNIPDNFTEVSHWYERLQKGLLK